MSERTHDGRTCPSGMRVSASPRKRAGRESSSESNRVAANSAGRSGFGSTFELTRGSVRNTMMSDFGFLRDDSDG